MRKLVLTLPLVALVAATALLFSSAGGVFASSELPTPAETLVASNDSPVEQSAADWIETGIKKHKPKKSSHKP